MPVSRQPEAFHSMSSIAQPLILQHYAELMVMRYILRGIKENKNGAINNLLHVEP